MSKMVTPAVSEYDDLLVQRKKQKKREDRKRCLPLYLMMLPGLSDRK